MDNPYMDPDQKKPAPWAPSVPPFSIRVRFIGGLSERQKEAFRRAANRWSRVIVGGLSPVMVDGEVIRDILILAEGVPIDGAGRVLGQAGPTYLRPPTAERGALLPAKGEMQFDIADLDRMELDGRLEDVIAHEMGHVLGIGTIWLQKRLVHDFGGTNPTFRGPAAMREYAALRGSPGGSMPVPIENTGGAGTEGAHWRETVVYNELMSGFISAPKNPLSRLTIASLQDLGYTVDMSAAEPYALPNLVQRAERGLYPFAADFDSFGTVIPLIPSILPEKSLQ